MSFEMYQRYLTEPWNLVEGGIVRPIWHPNGSTFCFAEGIPNNTIVYIVDPDKNTKNVFLDNEEVRAKYRAFFGVEAPYNGLPFHQFVFLDGDSIAFAIGDKTCRLDIRSLAFSLLADNSQLSEAEKARISPGKYRGFLGAEEDEIPSPDGKYFLGAEDFNLYLRHSVDGRKASLTVNGNEQEQWMNLGMQWSPNGQYVIAKLADVRDVPRIPIVHWLKQSEEIEYIHFPRAGEISWGIRLMMIDVLSKKQYELQVPDSNDEFINLVGWSPNGEDVLYCSMDRSYRHFTLWKTRLSDLVPRKILEETADTFLNFSPFDGPSVHFLKDGEQFLWISERNQWAHIYRYDMNGKLLNQITKGEYPVEAITAVDEVNDWVYFRAFAEPRLYDANLYRARLDGTDFQRLTSGNGSHFVQISPSMKYIIDTLSAPALPPISTLTTVEGKTLRKLTRMEIDRLKDELGWVEPEDFVVKADDGETDLYGTIYKPHDFDPNKRYGVIDYIYNGPHACMIINAFHAGYMKAYGLDRLTGYNGDLEEALAQLGFIVVVTEGRGSANRGKAFQEASYGNLGHYELRDHMAVIKQLAKERPWMDIERVGITGYSYGGYMTLTAMLDAPEFYKVGVAAAPVPDLYTASLYSEHYMDTPQMNPEGYRRTSCIEKAGNLQGKLLITAGTSETNAFFSGVMKLVDALIKAGKPHDLIVLPEQTHLYDGKSGLYFLERTGAYFLEHL